MPRVTEYMQSFPNRQWLLQVQKFGKLAERRMHSALLPCLLRSAQSVVHPLLLRLWHGGGVLQGRNGSTTAGGGGGV